MDLLLKGVAAHRAGGRVQFPDYLAEAFGRVLADADKDPAFAAEALSLPPEVVIAEQMEEIDPLAVHRVRFAMRTFLAERLRDAFMSAYERFATPGPYSPDAVASGRRALRNLSLAFLMDLGAESTRRLCTQQLDRATNMTDAMAALAALSNCDCPERRPALDGFHARWQAEPLVVDKWLATEALSRLPGTVERVRQLTAHPAFTLQNPNKVYALLGSFGVNQVNFHAADGSGYRLMTEQGLALDAVNPQIASRMVRNFERWRKSSRRGAHARRTREHPRQAGLSQDTLEVVTKALA